LSITIVGIGEALFDIFPDGREVLGGAPLNFAVHANRLAKQIGKQAAPVSRIGSDPRADRLKVELQAAGVSSELLQQDAEHPTGVVEIGLANEGQNPNYAIAADSAWDYLEPSDQLDQLAKGCEAVCFGTLAQRKDATREVIEGFVAKASRAIRLFDVNLRQDFYDHSMLRRGCALATAVKLNEEELAILSSMLHLRGNRPGDFIHALFDRFPLEHVLLTRAERGCVLYTPKTKCEVHSVSYPSYTGADAVGAGDGAAAGFVVGLLAGLNDAHLVELANHVGAFVASQPGATPDLPQQVLGLVSRQST
jgi:fructokinase